MATNDQLVWVKVAGSKRPITVHLSGDAVVCEIYEKAFEKEHLAVVLSDVTSHYLENEDAVDVDSSKKVSDMLRLCGKEKSNPLHLRYEGMYCAIKQQAPLPSHKRATVGAK